MGILVVGTWIRCSREHEFDHVDRRVGGIPGSLANVVEWFIRSHECGPSCGVLPVATPDVSALPTLAATRREYIRKRR